MDEETRNKEYDDEGGLIICRHRFNNLLPNELLHFLRPPPWRITTSLATRNCRSLHRPSAALSLNPFTLKLLRRFPLFQRIPKKIQDTDVVQESYLFPKPSPLLHRIISDPNPAFAGTPPRPPARRNVSRGESPNARRLRRMMERLKEMSQWANQVSIAEDGDETVESEFLDNNPKVCASS